MARPSRRSGLVAILTGGLACLSAPALPLAAEDPPAPPGLPVRAVALERRGYRIGESPPSAAVHVATDAGIFRSESGEGGWVRESPETAGPAAAVAIFQRELPVPEPVVSGKSRVDFETTLYAAFGASVLRSVDAGRSWSPAEPLPASAARALAAGRDGAVLAVDPDWPGLSYGRRPDGGLERIRARCESGGGALCLRDGRFRIEIEMDGTGGTGGTENPAAASARTDDSGTFWLARASNVVLTVEMRDARSTNGHFWFDFDARTIRGFAVVVTDMATGRSTRYSHPEGQRTKFSDHEAF